MPPFDLKTLDECTQDDPLSKCRQRRADGKAVIPKRTMFGVPITEFERQPAENKGNPDTPVWIDLHTALYYCPGSDLYGKTPKGRIASQRDAQLESYRHGFALPWQPSPR